MKISFNTIHKLAVLLALSIVWMFIHAIIHFHQEHVFGKNAAITTVTFIKPNTKDKSCKTDISKILKTNNAVDGMLCLQNEIDHNLGIISLQTFSIRTDNSVSVLLKSQVLRGPPVC